jgi:hypothetical protein
MSIASEVEIMISEGGFQVNDMNSIGDIRSPGELNIETNQPERWLPHTNGRRVSVNSIPDHFEARLREGNVLAKHCWFVSVYRISIP